LRASRCRQCTQHRKCGNVQTVFQGMGTDHGRSPFR
jgi:hypothetical protein